MASKGPPRFVSPIAAAKIRRAEIQPSIYELQETLTATAPAEMAATEIGTGVGVSGAPGGLGDIVPGAKPATTPTVPTPAQTARQTVITPLPPMPTARTKTTRRARNKVAEVAEVAEGAEGAEPVTTVAEAPAPSNALLELSARLTQKTDQSEIKVSPEAYMPANRRAFKNFIIQSYRRYQQIGRAHV